MWPDAGVRACTKKRPSPSVFALTPATSMRALRKGRPCSSVNRPDKSDGCNRFRAETGAQTAASQALEEGAEIIVGPLFAHSVGVVGQAARARGVPVIAVEDMAASTCGYTVGRAATLRRAAGRMRGEIR